MPKFERAVPGGLVRAPWKQGAEQEPVPVTHSLTPSPRQVPGRGARWGAQGAACPGWAEGSGEAKGGAGERAAAAAARCQVPPAGPGGAGSRCWAGAGAGRRHLSGCAASSPHAGFDFLPRPETRRPSRARRRPAGSATGRAGTGRPRLRRQRSPVRPLTPGLQTDKLSSDVGYHG